jgi:hypothetical protein
MYFCVKNIYLIGKKKKFVLIISKALYTSNKLLCNNPLFKLLGPFPNIRKVSCSNFSLISLFK